MINFNDQFDTLLTSRLSVWKKGGSGIVDGYGIESQVFIPVATDVPCHFEPGPGKEIVSDAAFGTQTYHFWTRPLRVDNPAVELNIHHWLQLNTKFGKPVGDPDPNGTMFDIKNIKALMDHHLEIEALLIEP